MRTDNTMKTEQPLAVTPRNSVQRVVLLSAIILALLVAVSFTFLSTNSIGEPRRIGYRAYRNATLESVVTDLEAHNVIAEGTTWESPDLTRARVNTRLLWLSTSEVLSAVAKSAGVEILCPVRGRHAEPFGRIRIQKPESGIPRLVKYWPKPNQGLR